ncbi:hypothetical protein CTAYLR_002433 [Chrysophaeum taylorii]|uniref:Palmitoyltransferase n=1 Tax=Chrysophaeum taylorii TaxID=2483200 RepID=A0AAD7UMM7_9STRA|nr:hypothetical protein CTAYLR_002433 [Chrysophaeum taylorii]
MSLAREPRDDDSGAMVGLFTYFPGSNRFLCGGRVMVGVNSEQLLVTVLLLVVTWAWYLWLRLGSGRGAARFPVAVGASLVAADLATLWRAATIDPGILPRLPCSPLIESMPGHVRDEANFCASCRLLRPRRARHCRYCDNCVEVFDHHCPWLGTCVGRRNYVWFLSFVTLVTASCACVAFDAIVMMLGRLPWPETAAAAACALWCIIAGVFVATLLVFHVYLLLIDRTTNEFLRDVTDETRYQRRAAWADATTPCAPSKMRHLSVPLDGHFVFATGPALDDQLARAHWLLAEQLFVLGPPEPVEVPAGPLAPLATTTTTTTMAQELALVVAAPAWALDRGSSVLSRSRLVRGEIAARTLGVPRGGATAVAERPITREEINGALQTWVDGVIAIGAVYMAGGDHIAKAREIIDDVYGFDLDMNEGSKVLFKPTKASEYPFRHDFEGTLCYFASTGLYNEDKGFAIAAPFSKIRYEISGTYIDSDSATALGHYWFTDAKTGAEVKVEFTFQYARSPVTGKLKVILHHSSIPYCPH